VSGHKTKEFLKKRGGRWFRGGGRSWEECCDQMWARGKWKHASRYRQLPREVCLYRALCTEAFHVVRIGGQNEGSKAV